MSKSPFKVKLVSKSQVDKKFVLELLESLRESGYNEEQLEEVESLLDQPEGLMTYVARVSSPTQTNPKYANLLKYCIEHGHWSVFETVDMTVEVETSRMISQQILRHRSFTFQEFSQRYAAVDGDGIMIYAARRQDKKNRQNSVDDLPQEVKDEWIGRQHENWRTSFEHYTWALDNNIAKECARAVLPLATRTKLYMHGSLRSWIHYLTSRCDPATQLEHREIALAIRSVLRSNFPVVAEAMGD